MKIAVVGSGVAGLSVAALLAKDGFEVEIYESSPMVGGKMYQYTNEDSLSWDTGPTLISLPNEIYRLFDELHYPCPELLALKQNCHLIFSDGVEWKLPLGRENIIQFFHKQDPLIAKEIQNVFNFAKSIYEFGENHLFHKDPPTFFEIGLKSLTSGFIIKHATLPLTSYDKLVDKLLSNKNLREFFYHFASYVGMLPNVAQGGILSIAHVELDSKVVFPKGGVYAIASAIYEACKKYHVKFNFNTCVTGASQSKGMWNVKSFNQLQEEIKQYDVLISNCDPFVAAQRWLHEPEFKNEFCLKIRDDVLTPSESQFVILFDWFDSSEISHHIKIFPESWKKSFEQVCLNKKIPDDPCVYLVWPHATDKSVSPRILFISAMAPNTTSGIIWNEELCAHYTHKILNICRNKLNLNFKGKVFRTISPDELETRTQSLNGGIYTASPKKFSPTYFHFSGISNLKNLYFVGAGVHPGAGVTMVMKSARRIAKHIIAKHTLKKYPLAGKSI